MHRAYNIIVSAVGATSEIILLDAAEDIKPAAVFIAQHAALRDIIVKPRCGHTVARVMRGIAVIGKADAAHSERKCRFGKLAQPVAPVAEGRMNMIIACRTFHQVIFSCFTFLSIT